MKKYPFLIILLFTLITSSCTAELTDENIVGTWNVIDFTSNADLSPSVIERGREVALTGSYKFDEGGTIQFEDGYVEQPLISKWELDSEKKEMTFTSGDDHVTYQIKSFAKNKIVWLESMGELGTNEYTLSKVE